MHKAKPDCCCFTTRTDQPVVLTSPRIRLATNLYSEQLLDRDHYLDWVMSGLENSPQSRLPMWILVAKLTWTDLLRSRKYGRRLVYALLGHLHNVCVLPSHSWPPQTNLLA